MNLRTVSILTALLFLAAPLAMVPATQAQFDPEGCITSIAAGSPSQQDCMPEIPELGLGDSTPCATEPVVSDPLHASLCGAWTQLDDSALDSDLDNDGAIDDGASTPVALTFLLMPDDADEDGLLDRAHIGVWRQNTATGPPPSLVPGYTKLGTITFQLDFFFTPAGENNPFAAADNGDAFDYSVTPMLYAPNGGALTSSGNDARLSTLFEHGPDARFGAEQFSLALYIPTADGEGSCIACIADGSVVFGGVGGLSEGALELLPEAGDDYPNQYRNGEDLLFLDPPGDNPTTGPTFPDGNPLLLDELHIKAAILDGPNNSNLDDDGNTDLAELLCGSNPTNRGSTCADWDGDGILNEVDANPFTPDVFLALAFDGVAPIEEEAPYTPQLEYTCSGPAGTIDLQKRSDGGPWAAYKSDVGSCEPSPTSISDLDALLNADDVDRLEEFRIVSGAFASSAVGFTLLGNQAPDAPIDVECKTGQTQGGKDPCVDVNHNSDTVTYTFSVSPNHASIDGEQQEIVSVTLDDGIHTGDNVLELEQEEDGTFTGEFAYPQGYGPVTLEFVMEDSGGATFTNTLLELLVLPKQPSAVTLIHEPYDNVEADFIPTVNYVFYVLVEGFEGVPSGTIYLEEVNLGGYAVEDEALTYLDCSDGSTYPGYNWPSLRGVDGEAHLGISKAEAYCTLEDRDFEVLYWFDGLWTGGEIFEYTFTVEGATSGPHVFDSTEYVLGGHFLPDVDGVSPPNPNDLCPDGGSAPTCLVPSDSPLSTLMALLIPECGSDAPPAYCADPTDQRDLRDTDSNGNKQEPNGQLDVLEERVVFTKPNGALDVYVVGGLTALPAPNARVFIQDPEADSHIVALVEAYAAGQALCVWTAEGAQPLRVGVAATGEQACQTVTSAWTQFNAQGRTLGGQIGARFGVPANQQLPLFVVLDENGDHIPEAITVNILNPLLCTTPPSGPALPTFTCDADDYVSQTIPLGGVPELPGPAILCPADVAGVFPFCAVDCEAEPEAEGCEPDPCEEDPQAEGCEPDPCEENPEAEGCEPTCDPTSNPECAAPEPDAEQLFAVLCEIPEVGPALVAGLGGSCGEVVEPDGDSDGVPDSEDNCPAVANPNQEDADQDGTGDACETVEPVDTDGDGVADADDLCPDEAGPASNGGCPDEGGSEGGLPGQGDPLACLDYILSEDPGVYLPAWHDCYTFLTGQGAPEGCDDPVFDDPTPCVPSEPPTPPGLAQCLPPIVGTICIVPDPNGGPLLGTIPGFTYRIEAKIFGIDIFL